MTKSFKKHSRMRTKQRKQLPRHRYETWQNYRVSVIRAPNGRFVNWHRVRYGRHPSRPTEPSKARTYARKRLAKIPTGRQVDAYGTFHHRKRRWKIVGKGKDISNAIRRVTYTYPPKPQYNFKRIQAEDISEKMAEEEPWDYFDVEIEAQY